MTDILLLILSATVGFLVGSILEKATVRRERFFFDLKSFCSQMQNNINFGKLSLQMFYQKFKNEVGDDFKITFESFLQGQIKLPVLLTKQQKSYVERFLLGLESVNTEACRQHLGYFGDYFTNELLTVQTENSQRQKLYKKLGVLTGAIVGIMLI